MCSLQQCQIALKQELLKLGPRSLEASQTELAAILRFCGQLSLDESETAIELDIWGEEVLRLIRLLLAQNFRLRLEVIREQNLNQLSKYSARIVDPGTVLSRKLGLVDPRNRVVRGLPNHLNLVSRELLPAAVRGAFLARGELVDPNRKFGLDFICPTPEASLGLSGLLNRAGITTKRREVRGSFRVSLREVEAVLELLKLLGAKQSLIQIQKLVTQKESRGSANRLANFDNANLRRSVQAAVISAVRVRRALEILGDSAPQHLAYGGRLRLEHEDASLEELGQYAHPPLTKDAIAGRIRRLLVLADKRAAALGIPDTTAGLKLYT